MKRNFLQHLFFLGTRRVRANQVYQDYISDRHHTHMNATQVSVGLFVDYRESLGFLSHAYHK